MEREIWYAYFDVLQWSLIIDDHPGDLVYVEALGNRLLILNTLEAVSDLLESRHAIYSDRPKFTMVGELMKLDGVSCPLLEHMEGADGRI